MNHHPMHICLDCGGMVSSVEQWKQVHARWHTRLDELEELVESSQTYADMVRDFAEAEAS